MTRKESFELFADPHLPWRGGFPYQRLTERLQQRGKPGLGPSSSAREVQDALFDLMSRKDREILDEIRYLDRRLVVDFFMYRFRGSLAEVTSAQWDRPMPVEMPDFRTLAEDPVDLAGDLEIPDAVDLGPAPRPVDLAGELDLTPLIDIGAVDSAAAAMLEEDDGR